jgi:sec-independent protein translocase protein TatC
LGCAAALLLGMLLAVMFVPQILALLRAPLSSVTDEPEMFLRSLEVTGAFVIALQLAFWSGLTLSAPFLALLLARFVFPGLTRRERRALSAACVLALCLFAVGALLAYYVVLPLALKVMFGLHARLGIRAEWTIVSYVAFACQLLIAFGLAFELPLFIAALGYIGLVRSAQLRQHRPHVIVAVMVLAAVLTPPDVFSQVLLTIPMLALYEICILAVRLFERRRAAREKASVR